jgi:hypothetical protein
MPVQVTYLQLSSLVDAASCCDAIKCGGTGSNPARKEGKKYQYRPPQYYSASATDQQLESQLRTYEQNRGRSAYPDYGIHSTAATGSSNTSAR